MQIVISGGTGFLGSPLAEAYAEEGHDVRVLTRGLPPGEAKHDPGTGVPGVTRVGWRPDGESGPWADAVHDADAVINLAGASIAKRWTAAHKREMWNSRIRSTRTLVEAMKSLPRMPATLLNASAVGIYGARGDEPITEASAPGSGFLASLCREWEKEALAAGPQTRVVLLRSGIALDREGGALPQMALPFRFFVGGPIGSGRQYFSWVHRDDWVAMASWALTTSSVSGPLNVTAPNPARNAELARTLGRVLRRPALLPVPAIALRAVVGEMAGELVTGQRALPEKARAAGFAFLYPELEGALREIYGRA
jgi:uncharacterized protein (TIGR01777 family)